MGLIDRFTAWLNADSRNAVIPPWLPGVDNYWPYANLGASNIYPLDNLSLTMPGSREEEIESNFTSYVQRAYKGNGVVFACMLARMMIFSEARFQFRQLRNGRPGDLFGTKALDILEHPFGPNSTTGDLLARVITDADIAGNFYATRRNDRIKRMRPDWVTMVFGTDDPKVSADDLDAEFLGIIYYPGGEYRGSDPVYLQRSQIAHFAPIPDPTAHGRGMSWLTPILREIMGDGAAQTHKLKFFENGGTPNLAITRQDAPTKETFQQWREIILSGHSGLANAYKWLFLTAGATPVPLGHNFEQMDFKVVQGAGETRIAAASGVHPVVVGLSEGMQGASLNAGNFNSARRLTADKTFRPLWRNLAGSLQTLVPAPPSSQLWYDDRDIAFLREDAKDAAEIMQIRMTAAEIGIRSGWKADDVIKTIEANDIGILIGAHTGLFSIQLQAPGAPKMPQGEAPGETPVEGAGLAEKPAINPVAVGNGKAPIPAGK